MYVFRDPTSPGTLTFDLILLLLSIPQEDTLTPQRADKRLRVYVYFHVLLLKYTKHIFVLKICSQKKKKNSSSPAHVTSSLTSIKLHSVSCNCLHGGGVR